MDKKNRLQRKRDPRRAAFIKDAAEIAGVSTRTGERSLNTQSPQKNEKFLDVFFEIDSRYDNILDEIRNWSTILNPSRAKQTT